MNRSDLNQSYAAFDQASTLVNVVELSSKSWLVAGTVPGVQRQPRKKVSANEHELLTLIGRWRAEGGEGGTRHQPARGGIRGWPRRLLALLL